MPLIQDEVVTVNKWLTMTEFTDLVTIAEMTPGPIAINAATFVGTKLNGFIGAIVATIGCITAPCIIVFTLSVIYTKYKDMVLVKGVLNGVKPAVVSLIASAGLTIIVMAFWGGKSPNIAATDWLAVCIFICALFALRKFKLNPILVMIICGLFGGFLYLLPTILK